MRIDLHTHSNRSDGTDSPRELVRSAAAQGIDVLGLTDHDTTEGWAEATEAVLESGITLVRGLEISCSLEGHGVHLTAYLVDPAYPPLVEELDRVLHGRNARLPATLEKLRGLGIDIEEHEVRRLAGDAAAMGRPHVADALVDKGVVSHRGEAFSQFLGPQGPAYVTRYAAPLEDMIRTVSEAGGVSVLAHPWAKRHNHGALDEERLAALQEIGLAGVEVDHQDHDQDTRAALRGVAERLGLVITGSSDYHGTGKRDHELGCNTTDPEQYARLLELARAAAGRAGRGTEVVQP